MTSLAVAIQGELGSNSELAVREYYDGATVDLTIVPCRTFDELFDAVHEGRAHTAMAPLENSLAGSIHDVWRLLVERHLPVCGELRLRIAHCLIGLPGSDLTQIRRVRSHPQALAQCQQFLQGLPDVEIEAVYDTAGAVQMLIAEGDRQEAAIASAQAAADHEMEVIARDLCEGENFTRFLALGKAPEGVGQTRMPAGELKTTLVLQMGSTASGLSSALGELARQDLVVLKVETHKHAGLPWSYDVYLEFSGDVDSTSPRAAIDRVGSLVEAVHVIGSYPSGADVEPRLHQR